MEGNQELMNRNKCKLCNKVFPCGRSLGGHMRSHVIMKCGSDSGDGLKQQHNRSDNTSDQSRKFCKVCGKDFPSWKSLFGHMKCHSEKLSKNCVDDDNDFSWDSGDQKLVQDSQSDNDSENLNRRRSDGRKLKQKANSANGSTTTSSSVVSGIEQEEAEEVAMCLMMLSKDVRHDWTGLSSVSKCSVNGSVFLEPQTPSQAALNKFKSLDSTGDHDETMKNLIKLKAKKSENKNFYSLNSQFDRNRLEPHAYGVSKNGLKMKKLEAPFQGLDGDDRNKKNKLVEQLKPERFDFEGKLINIQNKRKFSDIYDAESAEKQLRNKTSEAMSSEFCKTANIRNKFECKSCKKVFHSYQALGGHRAAHKRMKGCFASKTDQIYETTTETHIHHAEQEKLKNVSSDIRDEQITGHECPICFRVFSSGQALGGHKRSHLLGTGEGSDTIIAANFPEEPLPEARDFLDLNQPAPSEEESTSLGVFNTNPWWTITSSSSNNGEEPIVGLIYN